MFERYREDARRAIFFARWEAQQSGAAYIEPEHLLLSLTHDADAKANQLFSLTAHTENFRKQLTPHSSTKHSASEDLPLSNAGKRVLAYTAEEAERLASKPIGTEHLLLGLLREKNQTCRRLSQQQGSIFNRQEIGSEKIAGFQSLTASRTTKKLLLDRIASQTIKKLPSDRCGHSRHSCY
jgi:ATP-dependent Clp protease ATP-binding subunit ClpC